MRDTKILAKLADGDMIARKALYHKSCMNSITNQYRSFINKESNQNSQQNLESIVLAETMIYIEESLQNNSAEVAPFTKLSTVLPILSFRLRS